MEHILDDYTDVSRCPACGDVIDYCQGHGVIGDPAGARILDAHDDDDHRQCAPIGCEYSTTSTEHTPTFTHDVTVVYARRADVDHHGAGALDHVEEAVRVYGAHSPAAAAAQYVESVGAPLSIVRSVEAIR